MGCKRWYRRHDWPPWYISEEHYASYHMYGYWNRRKIITQVRVCRECHLRQYKNTTINLGHEARLTYQTKNEKEAEGEILN